MSLAQGEEIKIVENPSWRNNFLRVAKDFLGRPRLGLHVTDLIFPKRTYFRIRHPELGLTDDEVARFIAGRGHHNAIEVLAALPEYREVKVTWEGIQGQIDILEDVPIEIKTTRSMKVVTIEKLKKEYPFWIRQLSYYCAMINKRKGRLVVFHLNIPNSGDRRGLTPKLIAFDVDFEDLESIKENMLARKEALETSLATGDPSRLEPCPSWMCEDCRFSKMCK